MNLDIVDCKNALEQGVETRQGDAGRVRARMCCLVYKQAYMFEALSENLALQHLDPSDYQHVRYRCGWTISSLGQSGVGVRETVP